MTNNILIPAARQVTKYHVDRHARITINGANYRHVKTNDNGHLLSRDGDLEVTEFLSHAEFDALFRKDELAVFYGWHNPTEAELRAQNDDVKLSDLPEEEQCQIFMLEDLCHRAEVARQSRELHSFSDDDLRCFINQVWPDVMKKAAGRLGIALRYGGKKGPKDTPPSPKAFRTWRKRYEAAGKNPLAFRKGKRRCGNRTPRFDVESHAVVRRFARQFLDRRQVTIASVYAEYKSFVEAENRRLLSDGRKALHLFSLRSFEKVIGQFDEYLVCVAREGEAVARSKFSAARAGLYITRACERVEMDEVTINLHVWPMMRAEYDRMSVEDLKCVKKVRPIVTTALDYATRCIMGYVARGEAPSADSAITCLEMCVTDKTAFAQMIGAETPWDMAARIEGVAFDTGPAFMANATHAVVHDIKAKFIHPPAKKPQLRGAQERFYRTVHDSFTPFFAGQTYRNVVEKGDYDSEANACLCIDEFAELFGRWVIDVYHNTPHDGLNGRTPRNSWLEVTEKYPVQVPPGPEERRHIFGMRCERRIEKRGILIMGIYYQSKALQQLRMSVGQVPITVKVDRYNLAEISVWNQEVEAWMHVAPSATDLDLRGVTYWEWVAAARDLQRKNIDTSNLSSGTVFRAIQDIRQESDAAIQRADLHSHIMNLDDLNRVERDHFSTFNYVSSGGVVTDEPIDELAGFSVDAPTAQDDLDPQESDIPVDGGEHPGNSANSETDWSWE